MFIKKSLDLQTENQELLNAIQVLLEADGEPLIAECIRQITILFDSNIHLAFYKGIDEGKLK